MAVFLRRKKWPVVFTIDEFLRRVEKSWMQDLS